MADRLFGRCGRVGAPSRVLGLDARLDLIRQRRTGRIVICTPEGLKAVVLGNGGAPTDPDIGNPSGGNSTTSRQSLKLKGGSTTDACPMKSIGRSARQPAPPRPDVSAP